MSAPLSADAGTGFYFLEKGAVKLKISRIDVFPLRLPMKQNFLITGGSVGGVDQGAPHVYVRVVDDQGVEGWGEARPSHRWSDETLESVVTTLRRYIAPALTGVDAEDLETVHRIMNREIKGALGIGQPIAKAAVDTALHDLIGKGRNVRLSGLWLGPFRDTLRLSYLISTPDPEEAAEKARHAREAGFRGVDVKIGLDPRRDVEVLEAVKAAAPDLFFRVDANQAYTLPQAVRLAKRMEALGVDVFEQPLPAGDLFGHAELRRKIHLPVALDESVWTPGDVIRAVRLGACDAIVVKCTKMGGLSGAKRCGEIAREAGLELLGGGLTESSLGLAASAHLFNYLGIETPVDLNGPFFLKEDPVREGPQILQGGTVRLPDRPGIGCRVEEADVERYLAE
ncbi:MAG: dipeptide epimerase [Thermoactinomycetaceae bacterium]|nr:dipeptide epimerase [Bacillota bacterium]MBO2533095.1 dipeptide epimerase [Thermoactinomycetaceae bacterium]